MTARTVHIEQARAAKATRLAAAFTEWAKRAGAATAQDVADLSAAAPMRVWDDVADLSGIRRPSPATVTMTRGLLRDVAKPRAVDAIMAHVMARRAATP